MKPEKEQLLHDLLADETQRESTLIAGAGILRRRRHWRAAGRAFTWTILATATLWLLASRRPQTAPDQASVQTPPPATFQPHFLNDKELLALFPNTPVALATLPNGKKMLIFPRPADEARFVTRL